MKIVLAVDGSDQSYFAARALEHLAKIEKVTVLSRFLLGSVSHAVLHRAPCPVLILR